MVDTKTGILTSTDFRAALSALLQARFSLCW